MIRKYLKAVFLTNVFNILTGILSARLVKLYSILHGLLLKGFVLNKKKSEGIGLMNINSRVETIKGEFNLQPSPSSGTLATIKIPLT